MLFCVSGGSFFGVSRKVKGFACRKNSRVGGGNSNSISGYHTPILRFLRSLSGRIMFLQIQSLERIPSNVEFLYVELGYPGLVIVSDLHQVGDSNDLN